MTWMLYVGMGLLLFWVVRIADTVDHILLLVERDRKDSSRVPLEYGPRRAKGPRAAEAGVPKSTE